LGAALALRSRRGRSRGRRAVGRDASRVACSPSRIRRSGLVTEGMDRLTRVQERRGHTWPARQRVVACSNGPPASTSPKRSTIPCGHSAVRAIHRPHRSPFCVWVVLRSDRREAARSPQRGPPRIRERRLGGAPLRCPAPARAPKRSALMSCRSTSATCARSVDLFADDQHVRRAQSRRSARRQRGGSLELPRLRGHGGGVNVLSGRSVRDLLAHW
jgi:hypothetical protein